MISTVTTTTVTTVTTVALAASLALLAVVALLIFLVQKEILTSTQSERGKQLARVLNVAVLPLLLWYLL